MADIRIGIVSWNTADLLDRCLAAVPAAVGDLDAEVVVVDNASADASVEVARRHPFVTVVANDENLGYAKGMNQALAGSDARVLLALNPDTEAPPGSLAALVAELDAHPEAGLVVPRLLNADGTTQHSAYRFPSPAVTAAVAFTPKPVKAGGLGRRMWLEGFTPHDESGPIDWAIGAVHAIRASAVAGTVAGPGPYSERWFMYVEDLELCWRLHQEGWMVRLRADVSVPHVGNAAGAQAWGTTREGRYWDATYDFLRTARGRWWTRGFAAVNVVAVVVHLAGNAAGSLVPGRRRAARRVAARGLARLLPVHARASWGRGGR